jgi:hypothetical protein
MRNDAVAENCMRNDAVAENGMRNGHVCENCEICEICLPLSSPAVTIEATRPRCVGTPWRDGGEGASSSPQDANRPVGGHYHPAPPSPLPSPREPTRLALCAKHTGGTDERGQPGINGINYRVKHLTRFIWGESTRPRNPRASALGWGEGGVRGGPVEGVR